MTTQSGRAPHNYQRISRCGSSISANLYTVGARGFEPRTSSVSRNERQAIYQHKRSLTCGVVFVVVRHVPVITLCFAGFPRDGILPGPSCSMARMTALPVSTYACSSVAGAFIRPDPSSAPAPAQARGHAEDVQGRRCRQPGNPGGRRVGFRRRASPAHQRYRGQRQERRGPDDRRAFPRGQGAHRWLLGHPGQGLGRGPRVGVQGDGRLPGSRRGATLRRRAGGLTRLVEIEGPEIERVFREEYGRAVAVLIRAFGDIDIAEEAVQDAFTVAAQRWPDTGLPPSPAGWIITTAK